MGLKAWGTLEGLSDTHQLAQLFCIKIGLAVSSTTLDKSLNLTESPFSLL